MPQTKQVITSILAEANTQPKHRFGQNFMVDGNLVRLIAAAGEPQPGDLIVEVGPGTGTLTETILESGAELLAVEIDRDLAPLLRQRLADNPRFSLILGDALGSKHSLHPELAARIAAALAQGRKAKLIANLPYNIASPLVVELLLAGVTTLAFTVQKEVADRLQANANDDAYGPITVTTQMLSKVEVLRTLPPQAFWPPPKIDSALVRLAAHDRLGPDARAFSAFVQKIFSFRRKMIRKALGEVVPNAEELLARVGILPTQRCEEVSPEKLHELFLATR